MGIFPHPLLPLPSVQLLLSQIWDSFSNSSHLSMKKKFHFSSEIHTVFSYEISSLSVHLSLRLRLVNGAGLDRIAIEGGRGPKERLGEEDEGEIVGENVGESVGLPTRVGSHAKVPLFRASPITNKREGFPRTYYKS